MENENIYNFINEIIETAKINGFSNKRVNNQFDKVVQILEFEGEFINSKKIDLLKKYISKIISGKVTLSSAFGIISKEIDECFKLNQLVINEENSCGSPTKRYSNRCGFSSNSCGSSRTSISRCGSSSSSCGSSSRNSRC